MANKLYSWFVVAVTAAIMMRLSFTVEEIPPASTLLFWILLVAAVELLPVSLGYGSEVTMGFPLHLAVGILFGPWVAMAITGISAVDVREFRGQIALHRGLFNRAQLMLAVGATSAVIHAFPSEIDFTSPAGASISFPQGAVIITAATVVHLVSNLSLVSAMVATDNMTSWPEALKSLLPKPVGGFLVTYALLSAMGAATAGVYERFKGWAVAAFLIPLLFARLSVLGARAQQELSERVRKQQEALLQATERVFAEREEERHRIAEEIHDTSLQTLAAASYGCANAEDLIHTGRVDKAREAVINIRDAINESMKALRESLVDLRKSTVEKGGLVETVRHFAEQASVLWNNDVKFEGTIDHEPPIPVALAGFQILQEGLTNALKHGQGALITVRINDGDGKVHIVVEDEGPGFDTRVEAGEDHIGMRLMKERALRVGGSIVLNSTPGEGTTLEAILPGGVAT